MKNLLLDLLLARGRRLVFTLRIEATDPARAAASIPEGATLADLARALVAAGGARLVATVHAEEDAAAEQPREVAEAAAAAPSKAPAEETTPWEAALDRQGQAPSTATAAAAPAASGATRAREPAPPEPEGAQQSQALEAPAVSEATVFLRPAAPQGDSATELARTLEEPAMPAPAAPQAPARPAPIPSPEEIGSVTEFIHGLDAPAPPPARSEAPTPLPGEVTAFIRSLDEPAEPPDARETVVMQAASLPASFLRLEATAGPARGQTFEIGSAGATLGRSRDNRVQILDERLSRLHARVEFHDGAYWLSDAGSANGTFVNGERLAEARRLQAGDVITLGNSSLAVSFGPAPCG